MKITTKGRYGVRAVIYLASTYYNRPVSIKNIAENESISPEFLEQIFLNLRKQKSSILFGGPEEGSFLTGKRLI